MSKYRVPAFLHVNVGGSEVEMAFGKIMADDDLRGQVVAKALTEIEDWLDRWFQTLIYAVEQHDDVIAAEAVPLAVAMQDLRMKMHNRWPTWPNWIHDAQDRDSADDDDEPSSDKGNEP